MCASNAQLQAPKSWSFYSTWGIKFKMFSYTLFYLDPPYWGSENDYGKDMFAREEFDRMADQLGEIKGKFLMSINDVPAIRQAFHGFRMTDVATTYTVGTKNNSRGARAELLVSNFEWEMDDS